MPTVSVVIPSYNRRRTLPRAIASVLAQTMHDLELIVVDDGSTDGTREYLKSVADPRVKVIELAANRGAAGARNVGIEAATGQYIAFQDSDDEWLVTFLEKQLEVLAAAPDEIGVSYCGKAIYGRDDRKVFSNRRIAYMPNISRDVVEGDIYFAVLKNALVSTQTFVVRAALIKGLGGFNENLRIGIDWELSTRLAKITKYAFIDEPLVMTFISDDSLTRGVSNSILTLQTVIEKNYDAYRSKPRLLAGKYIEIARALQVTGRPTEGFRWLWRAFLIAPQDGNLYKRLLQGAAATITKPRSR